MVRAVFFDLDDTLCDDSGAWIACARKAARIGASRIPGVDAEKLSERFLAISEQYWMSLDYTTETRSLLELRSEQFLQALQELGYANERDAALEMAHDYGKRRSTEIELFPDALFTLDMLRQLGLHLVLITNGFQATHVEKVAHLGLEAMFDHVLIADAVGYFKPNRRIYEIALDLSECRPDEAIMVGDNLFNDVEGAQKAGIPAFWFNPEGKARKAGDPVPRLGDLRQLRDLLEQPMLLGWSSDGEY